MLHAVHTVPDGLLILIMEIIKSCGIKALVQESILLLFISIGSAAMPAVPWRSQSYSLSFVSVMILYLQKPLGARNPLSHYSELTESVLKDLVRSD